MEVAIKLLPMLVNWIDGFFSVVSVSVVLFMQQRLLIVEKKHLLII
jgi:hypothetical protein